MRYSISRDGIKRCTVRLEMRFMREEYAKISALAKMCGDKNVKDYLSSRLLNRKHLHNIMEDDKRMYSNDNGEQSLGLDQKKAMIV